MNTVTDTERLKWRDRSFTFAIPALAFGGILVDVLLRQDGTFVWGCVAASFLLGLFAYIKPKRDIVAICTPIYGIILFILPGEIPHTLPLQLLFAISITILLVRLNVRFGSLADVPGGSPMERFLREYVERIRPDFSGISRKTAHEIASAFFAFKFGLYTNTIEQSGFALAALPEGKGMAALKKALLIVQANAKDLENALPTADGGVAFTEEEKAFVAVNLPQEKVEDPPSLELDNALVLLYAVAMITSPDDEQALEEHQKFVIKILTSYKTVLGIL